MRQATAADLDEIHAIIQAAYAKYLSQMPKPPAPVLRDYTPYIEQGAVWVTGQPIAGLISLTPAGDSLLIENIAVHPAAQGTGLGTTLMRFAEQQARQRHLPRLTLYTHEVMTDSQAIYAHLGYREIERRSEDGYRRIYMEKILPKPDPNPNPKPDPDPDPDPAQDSSAGGATS